MAEFGPEPTFRTYLQILRRRKWRVGSITALGRASSLGFSLTAHKEYSATAQLLVQPSVNASGLDAVQQAVPGQLGSTPAVSASEVGQTNVIAVTPTSQVLSQAALVASLYASAYVRYRQPVATSQLAAAGARLRSQISGIEQQLRSFGNNTTSPEAWALPSEEGVLKEQLAQMQVSEAADTGAYGSYHSRAPATHAVRQNGAAERPIASRGALSGSLISFTGTSGAAGTRRFPRSCRSTESKRSKTSS